MSLYLVTICYYLALSNLDNLKKIDYSGIDLFQELGVYGSFTNVEEFNLGLIPFDSDLLSMELDESYKVNMWICLVEIISQWDKYLVRNVSIINFLQFSFMSNFFLYFILNHLFITITILIIWIIWSFIYSLTGFVIN